MGRIEQLDILKGLLIVFVVIGHLTNSLHQIIYWFHMPVFFFISGFLIDLDKIKSFKKFFLNKLQSYALPYISFFLLISVVVHFNFKDQVTIKHFISFLLGGKLLVVYYSVFWFISSLFFSLIGFVFLSKRIKSNKLKIGLLIGCFLMAHVESFLIHGAGYNIFVPYNLDTALLGICYIAMGYAFKKQIVHLNILKRNYVVISLVVMAAFVLVCSFDSLHDFDMKYQKYGNPFKSVVYPLLASIVLLFISNLCVRIRFIKTLTTYLGKASLVIMYTHLLFYQLFHDIISLPVSLKLLLFILIGSVLYFIFSKSVFLSYIFLGLKRKERKVA